MPLFEIHDNDELAQFRNLGGTSDVYEKEIEDLLWQHPEEILGEPLFPVARQPTLPERGRPDVVCLDREGQVVVIEIKRDVARDQLAQCLEYAGWAHTTNLQQLAAIYHSGHDAFFAAWQDFTESEAPLAVGGSVRLVLLAREFQGRTTSALEFLLESGLQVLLVTVDIYGNDAGRRLFDVTAIRGRKSPSPGPRRRSSSHA